MRSPNSLACRMRGSRTQAKDRVQAADWPREMKKAIGDNQD